jgi:hypothetical protein
VGVIRVPISLDILPNIISEVRSTLFDIKNQDLLKLIYHDTNNPFACASVTPIQLVNMVSPLGTNRRIFYNSVTGKIEDEVTTEIHMFVDNIHPENRQLANMYVWFQIVTHLNIASIFGKNSTSSFPNQNRHEAILVEMMQALNEKYVGGVGTLRFTQEAECNYRHQVWMVGEKWVGGAFAMKVMCT